MLGLARFLGRGGIVWLVVGAVGLAGLALTRVAYGWVLTAALLVLVVWWLVAALAARPGGPQPSSRSLSRCACLGSRTRT